MAQGGFKAYDGIDNAVRGKTLSDVLRRHPISQIPENSNVVINVGTNDAVMNATGSNSENIATRDARRIIDTAAEMQAAGHNVVVTSLPIALDKFDFYGKGRNNPEWTKNLQNISKAMNEEMERYAIERGVAFRKVAANPDPGADGLHLSENGYKAMYQGVVASLLTGNSPAPTASAASNAEDASTSTDFSVETIQQILSQPITMDTVRQLQTGLGVSIDGKFGPETLAALKEFVGDESLGQMSASNWALIARGARDAEGALWIKEQIGDDASLRRAVAGNIRSRLGAAEGTLAANQYQSSLSVLGYLEGSNIGTLGEATNQALDKARVDFGTLIPTRTQMSASYARGVDGGEAGNASSRFAATANWRSYTGPASVQHPLKEHNGSSNGYVGASRRGGTRVHEGRDYYMPEGTPVYAGLSGQVIVNKHNRGIGYGRDIIVLDEEHGIKTRYAHLQEGSATVSVGDRVGPDTMIAKVGSTGTNTNPHLHFEISLQDRNGKWQIIDPEHAYGKDLSSQSVRDDLIARARDAYGRYAGKQPMNAEYHDHEREYAQLALTP